VFLFDVQIIAEDVDDRIYELPPIVTMEHDWQWDPHRTKEFLRRRNIPDAVLFFSKNPHIFLVQWSINRNMYLFLSLSRKGRVDKSKMRRARGKDVRIAWGCFGGSGA
jgi:hypothetical protein